MTRVLVGMSGGVDSSVAAALLARMGHEVVGVSLQLHDRSDRARLSRCCSPEDFLDARQVASALGFPYYVINEEEAFSRHVLEYFVQEYRRGRTPNPCAHCNSDVKFEALARLAQDLGAGAVATGHYARLAQDAITGERVLLRALDSSKDQSYFLFDLSRRQMDLALFPLGDLTKEQVREEAASLGLVNAMKPDSQDVCFIENGDYRGFIDRRLREEQAAEPPGDIVHVDGRALGTHAGLSRYTVGQRRGLGVSGGRRLYVVQVDAPSNRVVLGEPDDLLCWEMRLERLRMRASLLGDRFEATIVVRYRHAGVRGEVTLRPGDAALVKFDEPVRGVSPGQAAVFYEGDTVLGGGWIESMTPAGTGSSRGAATVPA